MNDWIKQVGTIVYKNQGNAVLLKLVPIHAKTILDVGCGAGDNAKILSEMGKTVDGITISDEEIFLVSKFCGKVIKHNLEEGLPDGLNENYDIILCSHVLEHIAYPEKLLAAIRNKMQINQSFLLLALPNFLNYKNRLKIVFGKFEYEKDGTMDYTHLRWYTFKSAESMLKKNGFEVISVIAEENLPLKTLLGYLPVSIQRLITSLLIKISKGLFASQMIFVAKPER